MIIFNRRTLTQTTAMIMALSSIVAVAGTASASAQADNSTRFEYGRRQQAFLNCVPNHICDIALDTGEKIIDLEVGNTDHWLVSRGESGTNELTPHVFVRPTKLDLDTNLVITTTRRAYNIELRSMATTLASTISFFYPDEFATAQAAAYDHEQKALAFVLAGNPAVGSERLDTNYTINGDSSVAPAKIYNDGSRTYIQWMALPTQLPNVTLPANPNGGFSQIVNFRVVGSTYIVDDIGSGYDLVWNVRTRNEKRVEIRRSMLKK